MISIHLWNIPQGRERKQKIEQSFGCDFAFKVFANWRGILKTDKIYVAISDFVEEWIRILSLWEL